MTHWMKACIVLYVLNSKAKSIDVAILIIGSVDTMWLEETLNDLEDLGKLDINYSISEIEEMPEAEFKNLIQGENQTGKS